MNKPLWQPTAQQRENSLLMEFSKFINIKPKSFGDLWKWSIENPETFWTKFWDFSKIIGDKGKRVIDKNKIFNQNKFF